MSHQMDDQSILQKRLERILGWDESGEEMFEFLVSMESEEDALEYFQQLLGRSDDTIHQFVADVSNFKEGKPISSEPTIIITTTTTTLDDMKSTTTTTTTTPTLSSNSKREKPPSEYRSETKNSMNPPKKVSSKITLNSKSSPPRKETIKLNARNSARTRGNSNKVTIKRNMDTTEAIIIENHDDAKKEIPVTSTVSSMNYDEKKKKVIINNSDKTCISEKPAPPKIGKAKTICGCFGTKFKAIANCLNCGRILCEKEGFGYCPYCGHLVEKIESTIKSKNHKKDSATIHKERLLKFDREFTKRTVIYDDQSDYYSNASSMWIEESERKVESQKDEERRKALHERQKQVLDIVF